MKAIRIHTFGEPEVMQLEEVPDPQPGPGQVVVRVHAVGVNPVETYIRSGIYPKPPTPYTPGNDGAGVIAAIGPDVKSVAVGDRSTLRVPAVGPMPNSLSAQPNAYIHFPNQPHSPTVLPSTCRMARRITPCSNGHTGLPARVYCPRCQWWCGHCGRATRPCCWHDGHWHGRDGARKKLVLEQGAHVHGPYGLRISGASHEPH